MTSPPRLAPLETSDDFLHPSRSQLGSGTPTLEIWRCERVAGTLSSEDSDFPSSGADSTASGSDSAYGTLDEGEREDGLEGLRRSLSDKKRTRRRYPRSRSVGDGGWSRLRTEEVLDSSLELQADDSGRLSFDSSSSTTTTPFLSPSSSSSQRTTPEPSECDFDLGLGGEQLGHSRSTSGLGAGAESGSPAFLSRRHTLPRRKRLRGSSISFTFVSPIVEQAFPSSPPLPSIPSLALPPLTLAFAAISLILTLASFVSPLPLLHASPIHLLQPNSHRLIEYTNAALSPFLVNLSTSGLGIAAANLVCLKALEDEGTGLRSSTKVAVVSVLWAAIVGVRVLLAWIFGRVLGWAHPHLFSTTAIHQVGAGAFLSLPVLLIRRSLSQFAGLAPVFLTFHVLRASHPSTKALPFFQLALLAANFSTPIEQGGTGLWWGLSGVLVGIIASALLFLSSFLPPFASQPANPSSPQNSRRSVAPLLALLALPLLASYTSAPSRHHTTTTTPSLDTQLAALHPSQPHLLTILLMTAPRPGNPDFLSQTIESWLDALPPFPTSLPSNQTSLPSRIRLIVYTHFLTHPLFDAASSHFSSPYLSFLRDPRATSDRLDQRLHVARGLSYASEEESAYVVLTEDDFPLCPGAWEELGRGLVRTNEVMPDTEEGAGHCGVFFATGGSGLAIRGSVARTLPGLLLGEEDARGEEREERARRGEWSVRAEDEGADTPDLVIQDCLRGRVEGCEQCAPRAGRARVLGDRWGRSGLVGTRRLLQRHLGYNASTLPGRKYGKEEWACGWRQPFVSRRLVAIGSNG